MYENYKISKFQLLQHKGDIMENQKPKTTFKNIVIFLNFN